MSGNPAQAPGHELWPSLPIAEWQDTQVAHTSSAPKGSRLSFRFNVPDDLAESDADQSEDAYYLWRLNL